jgi:hypothetical protein
MTLLPLNFQFSQSSLQDYVYCPRRFMLRHLRRQAWPAVETEPVLENESRMRDGKTSHRLIQQQLLGLPVERLSQMAASSSFGGQELPRWWNNYLSGAAHSLGLEMLPDPAVQLEIEIKIMTSLSGYRLLARYDLLLCKADGSGPKFLIVDWKTAHNRPPRLWLAERMQTRLYPYVLTAAGAFLNHNQPVDPAQVGMIYWFAEHPEDAERFIYSESRYNQDREYLSGLIAEIERLGESEFLLTEQTENCGYCAYRSFCERGVKSGYLDQLADEFATEEAVGFSVDFDQIAEVEF